MAQAIERNTTSRRNFLVGSMFASAAVVAPLAVMAMPVKPGQVSEELKELAIALEKAEERYAIACNAQRETNTALNEWREANPEPKCSDFEEEAAPGSFGARYSVWMTGRGTAGMVRSGASTRGLVGQAWRGVMWHRPDWSGAACSGRHNQVPPSMECSMSKFTKELRQQIVEEFSRRHNGQYDANLFLKEVKETGESHPAYSWFEWDGKKAASEYRLWQARCFAKDLRIKFEVEEVGRAGAVNVRTVEMPTVLSPVNGRSKGGGYVLTDPNDPAHQAEHCHQAAAALRAWLNRYQAALIHAGYGIKSVESMIDTMEKVEAPAKADAA